ncbi:MAG: FAD-dependent oxidoreductase [Clostridiales bacterium]|nr:FAD-dependent oxidoreductase [Clostridiales bacterium]
MHDIIVVGGGTAGLTAAIYGLRANRSVLVLEKAAFGGQIAFSPRLENYPGIASVSGSEFADRLLAQAMDLGCDTDVAEVVRLTDDGSIKTVHTDDGELYQGRAVILATGAKHRRLGIADEDRLTGYGVCYCAVCDGDFYRGQDVVMVGGGNTALQEAIFLADICSSVTVVQDLEHLTGEPALQDKLEQKDNVRVLLGAKVKAFHERDGAVCGVTVVREATDEEWAISAEGVFMAIGLEPDNARFSDVAALDSQGYFDSDERCLTATPGVFVAGDCRRKTVRQLTTATADGTHAAIAACAYLRDLD